MNNRTWVFLGLIGLMATTSVFAADVGTKLDRQLCSVCHGAGGSTSSWMNRFDYSFLSLRAYQ